MTRQPPPAAGIPGQPRPPAARKVPPAPVTQPPMPVSGEDWAGWLRTGVGPAAPQEAMPEPWTALTWLARRQGFTVKRQASGTAKSQTIWNSRRIEVHGDLEEHEAALALLHELAHVLLDADAVHPPGASTAGCRGIQKLAADSVAFIVTVRLGLDGSTFVWPYVPSWAGSDPRARPDDIIRTTGRRVTEAAAAINRHLDITLLGISPQPAATASPQSETASPAFGHSPPDDVSRILVVAEHFYLGHLHRSWAPRYLASRGLNQVAVTRWRIGYAPTGWTTLTDHLRRLGHDDAAIQEAGLARRSSRGTLIDHFRDRVMLAIRDERGEIVGFIGRARPNADPRTPKYLNSPESATFKKGEVLFGLHEARSQLAHGAMPVLVEGPFDAIAVTAADPQRYAGLAPCGTAFTTRQAEALFRTVDLHQVGVLVALDGDRAGREAAIKAHEILLPHTRTANAAIMPSGRDPAEILQSRRPRRTTRCLTARRARGQGRDRRAYRPMGRPTRPRRRPAQRHAQRRRLHRGDPPTGNCGRDPVHHRWPETRHPGRRPPPRCQPGTTRHRPDPSPRRDMPDSPHRRPRALRLLRGHRRSSQHRRSGLPAPKRPRRPPGPPAAPGR